MGEIIQLRPREYSAKAFTADHPCGQLEASGTLCGCLDFVVPGAGTYPLTPDEALAVAHMLLNARQDVLDHSRPFDDPRLYDRVQP